MAWLPYVYQYGIMLLLFSIGLVLCWKQGDVGISSKRKRRNLGLLVGGMAFFMVLQGYLQLFTPPIPADVPGTDQDRFFARIFQPQGGPVEKDGLWKQPMRIRGVWFHGPTGKMSQVYDLTQDIDSGEPGHRFEKVCPAFGAALTDWHAELLEHFIQYGFTFAQVTENDCRPPCELYDPDNLDTCIAACLKECEAQFMKLVIAP